MEIETVCCIEIVRISEENLNVIFSGDWFICPYCGMKNKFTLEAYKPEEELVGEPFEVESN